MFPKPYAPISKLCDELLWYIFELNSVLKFGTSPLALHTLISASQVCTKWRCITLSASSLWSQVINFGVLRKPEWREEIMSRTGCALLCIEGDQIGTSDIEGDVFSILEAQWHRIKSLNLTFGSASIWQLYSDKIWDIIRRPTHFLETFTFRFLQVDDNIAFVRSDPPPTFVVFDNYAPSLRNFLAFTIKFDLHAPWLSNIRDLLLNVPSPVDELLGALSNMPLLENLHDSRSTIRHVNSSRDSLIHVTMPFLKMICIQVQPPADIAPYYDFLTHITPGTSCYLSFVTTSENDGFRMAPAILQTYSRFPKLANAKSVKVCMAWGGFDFFAETPLEEPFRLELRGRRFGSQSSTIDALLTSLSTLPFKHKVMQLSFINARAYCSDLKVVKFLSSMTSVERFETCSDSLQPILDLSAEILEHVLPALNVIRINRPEKLSSIKNFLTQRVMLGKPIRTLNILTGNKIDLGEFDELVHNGLEITQIDPILELRKELKKSRARTIANHLRIKRYLRH